MANIHKIMKDIRVLFHTICERKQFANNLSSMKKRQGHDVYEKSCENVGAELVLTCMKIVSRVLRRIFPLVPCRTTVRSPLQENIDMLLKPFCNEVESWPCLNPFIPFGFLAV